MNKVNATFRKKQDERSFMEIANSKLEDTLKLMKKHEKKLEKQLEDCMYESYLADEYNKQIQVELKEAQDTLREMLKESPTHLRVGTGSGHRKSVSTSFIRDRVRKTLENEISNPFIIKNL